MAESGSWRQAEAAAPDSFPGWEAAARFYRDYQWYVFHFLSRFLGAQRVSPAEYQEMVHETRCALWRAAVTCRSRKTFLAYATRLMRNALVDRLRAQQQEEERLERLVSLDRPLPGYRGDHPVPLSDQTADPAAELPEAQLVHQDLIARAFALLPNETYRQLLALKLQGYERAAELAARMGCTQNHIYSREYYLRRYLAPIRAELQGLENRGGRVR